MTGRASDAEISNYAHYVARSTLQADAPAITRKLAPLIGGRAPRADGRPEKRWSGRERKVVPLRPELVVEASADHITDRHFPRRPHPALAHRRGPHACTMDQIDP